MESAEPRPTSLDELSAVYTKFMNGLEYDETIASMKARVRTLMGVTPRTRVYAEHSTSLWHYLPDTTPTRKLPMLVLPSFVMKPVIMDLLPDQSFVKAMSQRGFDVYMLEWGEPTPGLRTATLGDYLRRYIGRAIRRIQRRSGAEGVLLAGYCLGGLAALLYAALDRGATVRALLTMVTPVSYDHEGMLSWWAKREHFDVEHLVRSFGNVPAQYFATSFPWIAPQRTLSKPRIIHEFKDNEEFMEKFLALDIWSTDHTDVGGRLYRDIIVHGYQENTLVTTRSWPLDHDTAELDSLCMPILNLAAEHDHICPPGSVTILSELLADHPDCTSLTHPTSHLGIALGTTAQGAHTSEYWDGIASWANER